jgi:DNA-binding PadR family transcriptional regulator
MDLQKARDVLIGLTVPPMRRDGDMTLEEYRDVVKRTRDIELSERQAQYRLDKLVEQGLAQVFERWDPFRDREVRVYEPTEDGLSEWESLEADNDCEPNA